MEPIINLEEKFSQKTEMFYDKFTEHMEILEKSPLAIARGGELTNMDYYLLGHQLEMFETYKTHLESYGNIGALGPVPKIAFDVITAAVGTSIMPLITSTQPIDEIMGMVFYEKVIAGDTRGNVQAGQTLEQAFKVPDVYATGYASEMSYDKEVAATEAGKVTYDFNLNTDRPQPVRRDTVIVKIPDLKIEAPDDGKGHILGVGCVGTVNYATGAVSITLSADPQAVHAVVADFGKDFEKDGDVPSLYTELDMFPIRANIFALQANTSLFASFIQGKRFGKDAKADAIVKLQQEINNELVNTAIKKIEAVSAHSGLTSFALTVPDGVALVDHFKGFKYFLSKCKTKIQNASGKGDIQVMVCGTEVCNVLESIPGFVSSGLVSTGASFHGTLDGNIVVVRAPQLRDPFMSYPMYKGPGMFESALIYAPYMPLVVADNIPSQNILKTRALAATMAGIEAPVPNYITRFNVVPAA